MEPQKQEQVAEFEFQDLLGIGMTLVVLIIGLAYGLEVTSDVQDDLGESACAARTDGFTVYNATDNLCFNASNLGQSSAPASAAFNGSVDGMTALAKMPAKLPMIVTIVIAAVIIGMLVRYMYVRFTG